MTRRCGDPRRPRDRQGLGGGLLDRVHVHAREVSLPVTTARWPRRAEPTFRWARGERGPDLAIAAWATTAGTAVRWPVGALVASTPLALAAFALAASSCAGTTGALTTVREDPLAAVALGMVRP